MTRWRKSTRSGGNGACVEARMDVGEFQVRDSKLDDASPIFGVSRSDFSAILRAAGR